MKLIETAVKKPIGIIAAVLIVVTYGIINLKEIPIQLTPDISLPTIEITTIWPKAAPYEIEREIINKQEEELKGLEGLQKITSSAKMGVGSIQLEFDIKQDMNRALLLVANRLDRVTDYPSDVDEPILSAAGTEDQPIAWIVLKPLIENIEIDKYKDFAEEYIQDEIERIPGVAKVNVYGGSELEMQIIVDPKELAFYKITLRELIDILLKSNVSLSAGDISEGKRNYIIRTVADFETVERVNEAIVKSIINPNTKKLERIKVSDIAKVKLGFKEKDSFIRHLGQPTLAINVIREAGANVIEVMEDVKKSITKLNNGILKENNLRLKQVYDETVYIDSAINLVQSNIIVGGTLAIIILMLFLRSFSATIIIAISIPISIIGSFIAMGAVGRSINVISLAGLAFAVGMVVDAAIIVLENIYRLKNQENLKVKKASILGPKQVWQAILISALTTVLVFIPILTMDIEIAQLFRDIAVAISVAVVFSLLVSITVIPSLSSFLFKIKEKDILSNLAPIKALDKFANKFSNFIIYSIKSIINNKAIAALLIFIIILATVKATIALLPKLEYLPEGDRNFVFGMILPPPGYNLETTTKIAETIEKAAKPHWQEVNNQINDKAIEPKIDNFFFVARENLSFVGATAINPRKAKELIPILSNPIFKEPGTFGFITQPSIFGRNISSGRIIDFDISGTDLNEIIKVAQIAIYELLQILPQNKGNQFRPNPGLEMGSPEVRVIPNDVLLADNGLSPSELATSIKVFNDGFKIDEVTVDNKIIDLTVKGQETALKSTQDVANLPIVTADGKIVPVKSLSEVKLTASPIEIRHKNRERTITIEIRPANNIPLEQAIEIINEKVITKLKEQKLLEKVNVRLTGTADKLTSSWNAIANDLIVAIIIVYLIMAILFNNFFYPIIILFSVPIAAFGGVLGLAILNLFTYQPLDMLTMLGFIILIGIVVNNAILIVHHTLENLQNEHISINQAILDATQQRIRPIFMSTLTSVFGMLPLVLFPGSGSELYRGLGSVVVGGLSLSAIITLIIVPILLSLFLNIFTPKHIKNSKN